MKRTHVPTRFVACSPATRRRPAAPRNDPPRTACSLPELLAAIREARAEKRLEAIAAANTASLNCPAAPSLRACLPGSAGSPPGAFFCATRHVCCAATALSSGPRLRRGAAPLPGAWSVPARMLRTAAVSAGAPLSARQRLAAALSENLPVAVRCAAGVNRRQSVFKHPA